MNKMSIILFFIAQHILGGIVLLVDGKEAAIEHLRHEIYGWPQSSFEPLDNTVEEALRGPQNWPEGMMR